MTNQNQTEMSHISLHNNEKNESRFNYSKGDIYLSLVVLFSLVAQIFLLTTFLIGITQYHNEKVSILTIFEFILNIVNVTPSTSYLYISNFLLGLIYIYIMIKMIKNILESFIFSSNIYEKDAKKIRIIDNSYKLVNRCGLSLALSVTFIILSYCIRYFNFSVITYLNVFIGIIFCIAIKFFNKCYNREKETTFMIVIDVLRNIFLSTIVILIVKLSLSQIVRDTIDGFSFLKISDNKSDDIKVAIYTIYNYGIENIMMILLSFAYIKITIHVFSASTYGKYSIAKKQFSLIFRYAIILLIGICILKPFFSSNLGEDIKFSKELLLNSLQMIKHDYLPIVLLSISGIFATSVE